MMYWALPNEPSGHQNGTIFPTRNCPEVQVACVLSTPKLLGIFVEIPNKSKKRRKVGEKKRFKGG